MSEVSTSFNNNEKQSLFTAGLVKIGDGTLEKAGGSSVNFDIFQGINQILSKKADSEWGAFYTSLFESIDPSDKNLQSILNSILMQDFHWSWFNKSYQFNTTEYEWFFMIAEEKVQGICIIYHPKVSNLEAGEIFYVEYVAVAPWNRDTNISTKKFKRIGTILLKYASHYSINILSLKPGFSLHSLQQSESYYVSQGMIEVPSEGKSEMKYYEMSKARCEAWRAE